MASKAWLGQAPARNLVLHLSLPHECQRFIYSRASLAAFTGALAGSWAGIRVAVIKLVLM